MLCINKYKNIFRELIIISCFSLFTLGFSTFLIDENTSSSSEMSTNFSYGKFVTGTNFISLNLNKGSNYSGIDIFKYNSKGFVKDEKISYDASIIFYLKFNAFDFYSAFPVESVNFKFTLKYENEFVTVFTMLTSDWFNNAKSSVKYYEGNVESDETNILTSSFHTDNTKKTISGEFLYSFNKDQLKNNKYVWIKIEFAFSSSSDNYSNLFNNELSLTNNKPKYVLNMEI